MKKVPELIDFSQERVRNLHFTWIAFFLTFYVWFNMAPLATTMLESVDWLTKAHIKVLMICNVALTIPARIIVGALIDKYGPRRVFSGLMVVTVIPALMFAFGSSFTQLVISRLILGSVGAGFVIGIKMVANWWPADKVGRAEGFYAGWGNFGSAAAAGTLAWFAVTIFNGWFDMSLEGSWRWALAVSGIICGAYGVIYLFIVKDHPEGVKPKMAKKAEPMKVTSYVDLVQYIVWSVPLIGALGLLAWKLQSATVETDGVKHNLFSETILYVIWGVLALVLVAHVGKLLQINLPYLKKGVPDKEKYSWSSVAALNSTYFANFGAELAVVSMLPMFFETVFSTLKGSNGTLIMTPQFAGLVAGSFAFVNLVARPLGGLLSDKMKSRKMVMLIYMFGIAAGFFGMALIPKYGPVVDGEQTLLPMFDGMGWLVVAVVITVLCSVFVQGAEGATFAIIPGINPQMTGQIAGMAGAYGNVGAVVYLTILSMVDSKTFFFILAGGALVSFLFCAIMLKEPKFGHGHDLISEEENELEGEESSNEKVVA